MPNDRDRDLNPEDGSEEKKYSFLQETIKSRPISREQLGKQLVRIAVYGVILGVFACLGFFALKPWVQNWFRGDLKTVTIPEDDEQPQETADGQETAEASAPVMDSDSYEQIVDSMNEIAGEAGKGVVSVQPVFSEKNWEDEKTEPQKSVTGVITADNGQEVLILADASICADVSEWNVRFQDGREYRASLKRKDDNRGLAVFSVARGNLADETWAAIKVSVLGNSNLVTQGDVVLALGNMFGYADGMGYGLVSSTDYTDVFFDGECDIIATDIPAEEEGTGVLFNMDGEVIGIASASVWSGSETPTVNAYAVSDLKSVIELLANGESVPYIGIYGMTVTAELAEEQAMPSGVYVVDVDPDSPAMAAGIQSGDIICEVAGEKVTGTGPFQRAALEEKPGKEIRLQGKRLGAEGYVDIDYTVNIGVKE